MDLDWDLLKKMMNRSWPAKYFSQKHTHRNFERDEKKKWKLPSEAFGIYREKKKQGMI